MIKSILKFLAGLIVLIIILFGAAFMVLPLPGHIPVLMYHFVGTEQMARESKNFVSRERFHRQMEFLKKFGYRVISMDEFDDTLHGKRKPRAREVIITFDDGNVSFITDAYPVLQEYRYPVTLFLITESLKTGTYGSMTTEQAKGLLKESWIHIGSHTKNHPLLSALKEDQLRDEIVESKKELEKIFGSPILDLAYPGGNFDSRAAVLAKEAGYRLAFTTSPKKLKASDVGPWSMTRVKISRSSDNPFVFWFKISGIYETFKLKKRQKTDLS